jgi:putative flippase GtrA
MLIQALKSRIPLSFWRFALVGVGGLFVDVAVLYAGLWGLGLSVLTARLFSFLAAATFTWWLNRQYTFGKSDKHLIMEWASFLATNAFGGFVNLSVYTYIVTQSIHYVWTPAVATGIGSLIGLFFNYLSSRHFVFNRASKLKKLGKDSSACESPKFPPLLCVATILIGLTMGGVALWFGIEASWDRISYHWHKGQIYVNGLTGR